MQTESCERCALSSHQVKQRLVLGLLFLSIAGALAYFHHTQRIVGWQLYTPAIPLFFGVLHLLQTRSKRCTVAAFTSEVDRVRKKARAELLLTGIITTTAAVIYQAVL